ncbi:MAG: response regulator [Magnetococcales bacterium]|nr:response regulator [Magnetococcales bacterium]
MKRFWGDGWFKDNIMVVMIAIVGAVATLVTFWLSYQPAHVTMSYRWLLLLGGTAFTSFLVIYHVQLNRVMQRHTLAKQALTDANRALLLLEQCHKLVNQEKNEVVVLAQACAMLVEVGGYRFAWCGFVNSDPEQSITPVANSKLDADWLPVYRQTWLDSGSRQEPARTAIRTRLPVALNTLEEDPQAIRFQYASALAIPLFDKETLFGILNLYAHHASAFDTAKIEMLRELANTLTFGILAIRESKRRKKAEKALEHHRQLLEEQVAKRTRLMNTVAAIAQRLLFEGGWKQNIDAVLQDLGMAANVSRAYVFQAYFNDTGKLTLSLGNEWFAEGSVVKRNNEPFQSDMLEESGLSRWKECLLRGEHLFGRTQDFPESEKAFLAARDIISIAIMPILVHGSLWGFLGFEDSRRERTWGSGEIDAMKLAANTLDAAIRKDRLLQEKQAGEAQILKLSTAVEQSPNIVQITDAEGRIEYINQKFSQITGFDAEEILGTTPLILQKKSKSRKDYLQMWDTLKSGQAWREEYQSVKKDGSQYWVHASLSPLVNEAGEITHFVCIQEDITQRTHSDLQLRNAFDKLARSENRLQAILDNMPSIVFLKDVSGHYVLANRLFAETFQLDPQAIIGRKDGDLFPAESAKKFDEFDREVLQRGLLKEADMIIPVGEEKRIFHTVRFPVVADDSGYFSICGIATDITERKIAQARLLRSKQAQDIINALLFAAMEQAPSMQEFIQMTLARILAAPWFVPEGKGAIYLMGANEDGSDLVCQIGLGEEGRCERLAKARLETAWGVQALGIAYIQPQEWPDGIIKGLPVGWGYYSAPLSPGGQIKGVIQIFLPATHLSNKDEEDFLSTVRNTLASIVEKKIVDRQLILAKEKAESASFAKSTFLANMSHEVRTPMNGVIGMLDLLGKTRLTAMQRHYVTIAVQSAHQQLSVINDILDFSKIEAGKLILERLPFNLFEEVENISSMLSGSAHNKGLEMAIHISWTIQPGLIGDAVRLRQVLVNLVGNAIKFTKIGEVSIWVDLIDESDTTATVRFNVIDTGIGIAPEVSATIFQPFVQADNTTTRRFGGTGLGLVIAKQIVEAMGGQMGVISQPGAGSMFWFEVKFDKLPGFLPLEMDDLREMRVLIVDDNDTSLTLLENCFRVWGIDCRAVGGGEEALALLRQQPSFTLVILDMQMPGLGGLEVARAIRGDKAILPVDLLLLSSGVHPEESVLNELGIGAFIMKPVGPNRLLRALQMLAHSGQKEPLDLSDNSTAGVASLFTGKVLLVEDTFVNQQVAAGMLKQMGSLEVEIAKDGQEGVDKAISGQPDIILMDMQMPIMDGLEATRHIRAWEKALGRTERVPILAMTANAMSGDRERCLESGMNDYLPKPVLWDSLVSKLEQWLPVRDRDSSRQPFLDQKSLKAFWSAMKGVPGTFTLVIEEFVSGSPELLDAMAQGVEDTDANAVYAAAHALKSNSATVGALALSELCATIERLARQQDVTSVVPLIKSATEAFQAAVPDLRAALDWEKI